MMTGSQKKKKIKDFFFISKKKGGGPLIRPCSLIRSNTVFALIAIFLRLK